MFWGFISPWDKDKFDKERTRPFNVRSETVEEKNYSVKVGGTRDV